MSRQHSALNGLFPSQMLCGFVRWIVVQEVTLNVLQCQHQSGPEPHCHQLQDGLQQQYQHAEIAIRQQQHQTIIQRIRESQRKRRPPDLQTGDLVLELTPATGPLQTGVKGPFLIIQLNPQKILTIAVLQTGSTFPKYVKWFKRHTSHLVKCFEPFADKGGKSALCHPHVSKRSNPAVSARS